MSEMRQALEQIKALTEIPFAHTAGDHELIYQIATEALAQHPDAVELTDDEIDDLFTLTPDRFAFARAVIAAHEAKKEASK